MRNSILILTENHMFGGLEMHIESEVRGLRALGFDVHLAVGTLGAGSKVPSGVDSLIAGLDIGPAASAPKLVRAVDQLRHHIRDRGIRFIHTHPFTSNLTAYLAAGLEGLPLICTLHGPVSLSSQAYGPTYEFLFRKVILPGASLIVCVSEEVATMVRLAGGASLIRVIPNPVAPPPPAARSHRSNRGVALAARLDPEKIPGIRDFLSKCRAAGLNDIEIFGEGGAACALKTELAQQRGLPGIKFNGWSYDFAAELCEYRFVAGMGRIVLEAGIAGRPVILVGYDGVKGLLDKDSFLHACHHNFSGRGMETIDGEALGRQIASCKADAAAYDLRLLVEERFDEKHVWQSFADHLPSLSLVPAYTARLLFEAIGRVESDSQPLLQDEVFRSLLVGSDARANPVLAISEEVNREVEARQIAEKQRDEALGEILVVRQELERQTAAREAAERERDKADAAVSQARLLLEREAAAREAAEKDRDEAGAAVRQSRLLLEREVAGRAVGEVLLKDQLRRERGARNAAEAASSDAAASLAALQRNFDLEATARRKAEGAYHDATASLVAMQRDVELENVARKAAEAARDDTMAQLAAVQRLAASRAASVAAAQAQLLGFKAAVESTGLQDALNRLWVLAGTRSWRVAKLLQYVHAQVLRRGSLGRRRALKNLLGRLFGRPVGMFDQLRFSLDLIANWKHTVDKQIADFPPDNADVVGSAGPTTIAHQEIDAAPPPRRLQATNIARGMRGLVSIVLPVYNQANFLPEAIEGVLKQNYPDWELLIVNDGSTDAFDRVVAPYLADPRIRVLAQPNQRLPSALNNGFAHARGEYLTWTSADNIMLPDQLRVLVDALARNPDAGLVYSDYEAIDDCGQPLRDAQWRHHNRVDGSPLIRLPDAVTIENFHDSGDNFLGASFLWRADVHAVVGCYDESAFGGEDYDFWLRMHLVTDFVHVPQVLYKYRVHDNTLNAKAKELGLLPNIQRLLAADRERRSAMLRHGQLAKSLNGPWRDVAHYKDELNQDELATGIDVIRYDVIRYSDMSARGDGGKSDRVRVLLIDAPLQMLNVEDMTDVDIIVAPDELTFFWLKRQELPRNIRLFADDIVGAAAPLAHASAMCRFERQLASRGQVISAQPRASFWPKQAVNHVLLVVGKWRRGGVEQVVLDLATGLAKQGVKITIAAGEEPTSKELRSISQKSGFKVLGFDGNGDALCDYVQGEGVDLVNYHHCTLSAEELSRLPVAKVYTIHNSYIWFNQQERARLERALRWMDSTISVSRHVAAYASHRFGIDTSRNFFIPNGTGLNTMAANGSDRLRWDGRPRTDNDFAFLNIASFNRLKAQGHLLRAFALAINEIPNASLTLVGSPADQAYYDEILYLRKELGIEERVSLVTGIDREGVIRMMPEYDCFVLPSVVEGCSISLIEAAMSGMPIIATDVGAARDMATYSRGVMIVPALEEQLQSIDGDRLWTILRSPASMFERSLARSMVAAWRNCTQLNVEARKASSAVAARYSVDVMAEAYLDCFREARVNCFRMHNRANSDRQFDG